jgi:hypothetical protein
VATSLPQTTENGEHGCRCTFILQKYSSILRSEIIFVLLNFLKNYSITSLHKMDNSRTSIRCHGTNQLNFHIRHPTVFYGVTNWHVIAVGRMYINITVYVATVSTHIGVIFRSLFFTK